MAMDRTELRYEIHRRADRALRWVVWRLPRRLVMWSFIRVLSNATTGEHRNQIVPELTALDALGRWGAA